MKIFDGLFPTDTVIPPRFSYVAIPSSRVLFVGDFFLCLDGASNTKLNVAYFPASEGQGHESWTTPGNIKVDVHARRGATLATILSMLQKAQRQATVEGGNYHMLQRERLVRRTMANQRAAAARMAPRVHEYAPSR